MSEQNKPLDKITTMLIQVVEKQHREIRVLLERIEEQGNRIDHIEKLLNE